METLHHHTFPTSFPVGALSFAATDRGLAILSFRGIDEYRRSPHFAKAEWIESRPAVQPYFDIVNAYLHGRSRTLDMALDLRGTDFQLKCWNALLRIPFGQTRSYADIAEEVQCPRGFRAVGMANNKNPVAIVVPCHRVIETNGKLGGYGGGLPAKEWLLQLEGAPLKALAARLF
jgi:methylated-DNA-[protein]-cysteine S-methyltransferase